MKQIKFENLRGKTLSAITVSEDKETVEFLTVNGERYQLFHDQDCCESVTVEDINGDLNDLINSPILLAEEAKSESNADPQPKPCNLDDSWTWTFYKLATNRGSVTLRWLGTSNGYYSESVDFYKF